MDNTRFEDWVIEAATNEEGFFDEELAQSIVDGFKQAEAEEVIEPEEPEMTFNDFITDLYTAAIQGVDETDLVFIKDVLKLLIDNEEIDNFLFMAQNADENGISALMSCMEECLQLENSQENLASYLMVTPVVIPDEGEVVDFRTEVNLKLIQLYNTMNTPVENPTE